MFSFENIHFPQSPTVIALSGGVDSMVLCTIAMQFLPKESLFVAHFDHSLRGEESDQDRLFVEEFAKKQGLRVFVGKEDIVSRAKEQKMSIEETARKYRYEFLGKVLEETGVSVLMTAHHLDDRIETLIFHLIRGTKFSGIYSLREEDMRVLAPDMDPILLRRPLIHVKKSEILSYARENHIPYREDSTNKDREFQRNFLRHEVLPKFSEINPEYQGALSGFINYVEDFSLWQEQETFLWLQNQQEKYQGKSEKYDSRFFFSKKDFTECHHIRKGLIIEYLYKTINRGTVGFSEGLVRELIRFVEGEAPHGVKVVRGLSLVRRGEWILVK